MTAWTHYRYGGPRERWWLKPPYPDETIDSVMERASHVYGGIVLKPKGWFTDVLDARGTEHVPLHARDFVRLARLLSTNVVTMRQAYVPDHDEVLVPGQRRAYCAQCWREDDGSGRVRYFRKTWAGALTITCEVHNEPLAWGARPLYPMGRMWIQPYQLAPLGDVRELMDIIDQFAATLRMHLYHGAPWPPNWHLSAYHARALLCHCLGHLESGDGRAVGFGLWPGPGPATLYQHRREDTPPSRGNPWEVVRRAGPPSWRRSALWAVASRTLPDFPRRLVPGGISEVLSDISVDALQRGITGSPGRRLQRLRHALLHHQIGWAH